MVCARTQENFAALLLEENDAGHLAEEASQSTAAALTRLLESFVYIDALVGDAPDDSAIDDHVLRLVAG